MVGVGRESRGAGAPAGRPGSFGYNRRFGPPTLCLPGRHRSPFLGPFARTSPAALRRNGDHRRWSRRSASLLLAIRFVVFPAIDDYREPIAQRLAAAARAARHDRRDRRRLGWLESASSAITGLAIRDRAQSGRRARAAAAAGGRGRRVDVGAGARPAAQGAHDRAARSSRCAATGRDGCTSRASRSIRTRRKPTRRFTDWLLRQRQIVVHDALLTWTDELRDAPQLVLDHVMFRLEQHARRTTGSASWASRRRRSRRRSISAARFPARRSRTGARRRGASTSASTTPTSRSGANGSRSCGPRRPATARCASGSTSRAAARRTSSPTSSSPT